MWISGMFEAYQSISQANKPRPTHRFLCNHSEGAGVNYYSVIFILTLTSFMVTFLMETFLKLCDQNKKMQKKKTEIEIDLK